VVTTIASVDLGWAVADNCAENFLKERGRTTWLATLNAGLKPQNFGFANLRKATSSYARSSEHGRPTFAHDFESDFMPLEFTPGSVEHFVAGGLAWRPASFRFHSNGALSLHYEARQDGEVEPRELIRSFHEFRLQVPAHWQAVSAGILDMWNTGLTGYALEPSRFERLSDHLEFFDIVDLDYLVGGVRVWPKKLYKGTYPESLKALAGIARMSAVYKNYSLEACKVLSGLDLGNRSDEFWIVNAERLVRHHPEQLSDIAKQLFLTDVILGIDIACAQRATLDFLVTWSRRQRAVFLDQLTLDPGAGRDEAMRSLLKQIAWSADLYRELPAMERSTGSSFFGILMERVQSTRGLSVLQNEVTTSVSQALEIADAMFAERTARSAQDSNAKSLEVADSSRRAAQIAVWIAVAALLVAVVQLTVALWSSGDVTRPTIQPISTSVPGSVPVPSMSNTHSRMSGDG